MKNKALNCCLFSFGYTAYSLIELAFRRYTHFTMGIAGGLCFVALYHVFNRLKKASLLKNALLVRALSLLLNLLLAAF